MYVRDVGRGEIVLLLHGTPSPAADFEPIVEELAGQFRVLVPDLPGYGATPPDELAFDRVGVRLAQLLDGPCRAIVGFSGGAYRALDLALQRGVRPGIVVLLGGRAHIDTATHTLFVEAAHAIRSGRTADSLRAAMPQQMLSARWRAEHPEDDERVRRWVELLSIDVLADELEAAAHSMADLRPELPRLQSPLVARVGELDLACPPELSAEIVRLVPRGTLEVVAGCGHALLIEDREATMRRVVQAVIHGVC